MESLGHGKLILFGEHAVVMGMPGLGIPLQRSIRVHPSDSWSFGNLDVVHQESVKELFLFFKKTYGEVSSKAFTISGDLPIAGGLGSSGALCVALIRQMYPDLDYQELVHRAKQGEHVFHGSSSGIDPALSAADSLLAYYPQAQGDRKFFKLQSPNPLKNCIVYGVVPRNASAKELIARIQSDEYSSRVKTLGAISNEAIESIDLYQKKWPDLLSKAQEQLIALGLSSPEINSMLHTNCGSLGGKLSGAGGGGAYFHVFKSPDAASRGLEVLRQGALKVPHVLLPEIV